jgi:hypothetical protein
MWRAFKNSGLPVLLILLFAAGCGGYRELPHGEAPHYMLPGEPLKVGDHVNLALHDGSEVSGQILAMPPDSLRLRLGSPLLLSRRLGIPPQSSVLTLSRSEIRSGDLVVRGRTPDPLTTTYVVLLFAFLAWVAS